MKKIFYITILIFVQCSLVYSQSGWVQQSPLPTSNTLYSVKFVNNSTGFICGTQTILKTTNNGILWYIIDSNSSFNFNSLNFFNSNTILVLGSQYPYNTNFKILKTTNGGVNWTQIDLPTTQRLFNLGCTTNNTAYIVGDSGVILKTTNRGDNWILLPGISTDKSVRSVYFVNEFTGYITALYWVGTSIFKTTNGGNSWVQQTINQTTGPILTVFFLDENTGYTAGGYSIFKTTDGGNNWNLQNSPITDNIASISFANPYTGYAVGDYGTILRTTDGQNWTFQITYLYHEESLKEVFTLSPDSAFLVGALGMIAITSNGGNDWISQFSGSTLDLYSICFPSYNTGYAVGIGDGDPNRNLIKTTNGGINWFYRFIPSLSDAKKVYFLSDTLGFILSENYILKTTDGGSSWINCSSQQSISYNDINFVNDLTGYVTGDSIFKTSNGGINWFTISKGGGLSIKFIDFNTGYISGYFGEIIKTSNGGMNWFAQNSGTSEDLYSIYFNNSNTGYICGGSNILKTTNGGNYWTTVFSGVADLRYICFINPNTGYAVGESENLTNVILKTTNGGLDWLSYSTGNDYLYSVFFINDSIGYCAGSSGQIYKTTNGGTPIGININKKIIPKNYYLYQNFPNPFNPTTKIKFSIPQTYPPFTKGGQGGFVTLKIYDILGREISVLVNEKFQPGTYEVTWDGSKYASGVYFYSLIINNKIIESKKMMVLR